MKKKMTYADFITLLKQYPQINPEIVKANGEINHYLLLLNSDRSNPLSNRYRQELCLQRDKINYLIALKKIMDLILLCLDQNERRIIEMRHFENKSWETIAGFVFYSREWLPKVEKKIVQKMILSFSQLSPKFQYLVFMRQFQNIGNF